jgi:hypothetical protein
LQRNEITTQDTYAVYAKTWILPRWGNMRLEQVKTVEVERWLRTVDRANGTKAKIKTVMSAIFSHAVTSHDSRQNILKFSSGNSGSVS